MSHPLKTKLLTVTLAAAFLPASLSISMLAHADADNFWDERAPGPVVVVRPGPQRPGPPFPGRPPGFNPGPVHPGGPGFPGHPPFGAGHPPFVPGRPLPGSPRPPSLRPPVIVVAPHIPGHVYTPPCSRDDDDDEIEVTRVMVGVMHGRACERVGDVLRELANVLDGSATFANHPGVQPVRAIVIRPGEQVEEARRRWSQHLSSARFWQIVWNRLAQMYSSCDKPCFDDGVAVGQISATGYCSASIAVGGLNAPGAEVQKPLPLCQNETFTGCLVGYDQTSSTYAGCSTYVSGGYTEIYNQSKSQDCHMD